MKSGLIGKAGELLVAAELLRRGIVVATPHADVGVDLIAYKLESGDTLARMLTGIQVKTASGINYTFHKAWFQKSPFLVWVWNVVRCPEFYVFDSLDRVELALGPTFSASASWVDGGKYHVTDPGPAVLSRMVAHRDKWDRITDALSG